MTLLYYLDNEVPDFGEWTTTSQANGSTIIQSPDAAWPERGSYGIKLHVVAAGSATAYAYKDLSSPLNEVYWALWVRRQSGTGTFRIAELTTSGGAASSMLLYQANNELYARIYTNAGSNSYKILTIANGQWYYVAVRGSFGAADGKIQAWTDGVEVLAETVVGANDMKAPARVYVGATLKNAGNYGNYDFDEIKIADSYPEPCVTTPSGEYLSSERICVLYRLASPESREFADHCVSQLNIPRANLVPLPNASANESLADLATYESEIEDDVDAYFALNPTVAANCTCFLIGYGVPGYFTSAGTLHSVVSRLMKYGAEFSPQTGNSFYGSSTRPTATALSASHTYLAVRIDADTLQHAKETVNRAATVSALPVIPDADRFASDDDRLLASLAVQKLRMVPEGTWLMGDSDTALIIAEDVGSVLLQYAPEAGSRVCIAGTGQLPAATFRVGGGGNEVADALINRGWASAFGLSAIGDNFDGEAFCDALREGWTFAEAVLVSVEHLDCTAVPVGSPLMTVNFAKVGHNIHHGLADPVNIEWASPAACVKAGVSQLSVLIELQAGQKHVFAARTVSESGIVEESCDVLTFVETDGQGQLVDQPIAVASQLTAELVASGIVRLGFSSYVTAGRRTPSSFEILTDNGTGALDLQAPAATITVVDAMQAEYVVAIDAGSLPAMFAVRPRLGSAYGPVTSSVTVMPPTKLYPPELL